MKITVFTSNQRRHQALIATLASIADEVWAVQECVTAFPGQVEDFYQKSPVMQEYFSEVLRAEREVFPDLRFSPTNVRTLALRMGDVSLLEAAALDQALDADWIVVNGASYIRGELADRLVELGALNIHLGTSPYFRGSACNFWAIEDGHIDHVGATIHMLSVGLDSGGMLFHALPSPGPHDPFTLGMLAVRAAYDGLATAIQSGRIRSMVPAPQDKGDQIRYSRYSDWTDDVAETYLRQGRPVSQDVEIALKDRDLTKFLRPYVGESWAR